MSKVLYRARPRLPRPPSTQSAIGTAEALAELLGIVSTSTRLPVNERTVQGLPAAWAAMNKIANAVAQMMAAAEAFGPDRRTPIATPTVLENPLVDLDSFTYWKLVATTAIARGNFVGINLDHDAFGYARQVLPVPFDAVNAYYDEDGFAVYEIGGEQYRPDELTHVRVGITLPGELMTIGVVEAHRRGLSGMLDQQGMAAGIWREGAVPSGVVQVDTQWPTKDQTDVVKQGWIGMLEGRRTVAVTGKAMTYTPIQWSADDAQFLESRQFSVAECALMFGFRPEDLGSSFGGTSAMTYGNRTDDALQRIIDVYAPVMLPIEQAWSRLIPGRNYVEGKAEALLRGSTKERYELHEIAQRIGLETQDETRADEGKAALPPAAPAVPPTPAPTPAPTTTEVPQ